MPRGRSACILSASSAAPVSFVVRRIERTRTLMKRYLQMTGLLVTACAASFWAGCAHPIAGIMHPEAERAALIKSSSRYPNVLLSVDERSGTLRYLSKDAMEERYSVNTYNYDGRLLGKTPFPKFSDSCWRDFGYGARGGTISPDYTSAAYLEIKDRSDKQDKDLCCFNSRSGSRKVVVKNLAQGANSLMSLFWVSDTELLVAADDFDKPDARLLLINTEEPSIKLDLRCGNLRSRQFMLSHSKRYLAYWEGAGRHGSRGSFKIFDLHERKEIAVTEPGEPALHSGPKWSPEDDALVYVIDHKLMRFRVASQESEVLKTFGPHVDVALQDYQGTRLYYRVCPTDTMNPVIRLHCFDLLTRQETTFRNHPEGMLDAYVCSDGTIIYYILGQEPL